jgi:hypothetical protein
LWHDHHHHVTNQAILWHDGGTIANHVTVTVACGRYCHSTSRIEQMLFVVCLCWLTGVVVRAAGACKEYAALVLVRCSCHSCRAAASATTVTPAAAALCAVRDNAGMYSV